ALVFEMGTPQPDTLRLVVGRSGRVELRVEAEGREAHAGNAADRGANAVVAAAELILRLAGAADPAPRRTVNLTPPSGGTALNPIPAQAAFGGELRAPAGGDLTEGLAELTRRVAAPGLPDGCRAAITFRNLRPPWEPGPGTQR